jgi:hypothetical protein
MAADKEPFLARWSRLKREAAREKQKEKDSAAPVATAAAAPPNTPAPGPAASGALPPTTQGAAHDAMGGAPPSNELPPVEALTFDSDFAPYFQPQVDAALKRQALKQLLRDPRFNVMDGLDIYIGDYTQPDPIPPEIVREMVQGRYIFDPPPTRINAQGHVEDVPPEELAALRQAEGAPRNEALVSSEGVPSIANTAPERAPAPSPDPSKEDEVPPAARPSATPDAKDESAQ